MINNPCYANARDRVIQIHDPFTVTSLHSVSWGQIDLYNPGVRISWGQLTMLHLAILVVSGGTTRNVVMRTAYAQPFIYGDSAEHFYFSR